MNLQASIMLAAEELRRPLLNHPYHYKTVSVDFDGVLNKASGPYTKDYIGAPIPEGLKLLSTLLARGYNVVIFTARKETDLVATWLKKQGFPNMFVTNHKVPSLAYIDDRALPWADDSKAEDVLKHIDHPEKILKLKAERR